MSSRRRIQFDAAAIACAVCAGWVWLATTAPMFAAQVPGALFHQDFQEATVGQTPEGMQVLDGAFSVREENGARFLELPGSPLDTYGVVFGPAERQGVAVSAKIFGTNQRRRYPAFGVGLNGVGGFRLLVAAAKQRLELYRGDNRLEEIPYQWTPGAWTHFRLQVTQANGQWAVQGKAWTEGQPEPKDWMIVFRETKEPYPGRASIWGQPYSGTPIRFDDLTVTPAKDSS